MKISHKLCVRIDGTHFFYYDGLQPEMRAGIINERECKNDPSQMISTHCDQCWKLFLLKVSDAAASASWPISW